MRGLDALVPHADEVLVDGGGIDVWSPPGPGRGKDKLLITGEFPQGIQQFLPQGWFLGADAVGGTG